MFRIEVNNGLITPGGNIHALKTIGQLHISSEVQHMRENELLPPSAPKKSQHQRFFAQTQSLDSSVDSLSAP